MNLNAFFFIYQGRHYTPTDAYSNNNIKHDINMNKSILGNMICVKTGAASE